MSKKTIKSAKKSGNEIIVQVKKNQPRLFNKCQWIANNRKIIDQSASQDKAHGRIENRKVRIFDFQNSVKTNKTEWNKYVKIIIQVKRERNVFDTKAKEWKTGFKTAYYLSTIKLKAKDFNSAIRSHWEIENSNHYVRDVSLNEDKSRIRVNPDRFIRLKNLALNIMRKNKVKNIGNELYRNSLNINRLFRYTHLLD